MKNNVSRKSSVKRTCLSSALAGIAVLAGLVLQPMTVLADTIDSVAVTGFPEPVIGQDIPNPNTLANNVQTDNANVYVTWAGFTDNGSNCYGGQFQAGHTYTPGLTMNGLNGDIVSDATSVTINGNSTRCIASRTDAGVVYSTFESDVSYSLAEECAPAPAPAPAATPHDANEQAALQQQAMERELQAAGVTATAAPAALIAAIAPNGDFTAVRNMFRQAVKANPAVWSVYSKAANGNTNAIFTMFNAAANGDTNAILALYAAASKGNPYAAVSLQLLGLSL